MCVCWIWSSDYNGGASDSCRRGVPGQPSKAIGPISVTVGGSMMWHWSPRKGMLQILPHSPPPPLPLDGPSGTAGAPRGAPPRLRAPNWCPRGRPRRTHATAPGTLWCAPVWRTPGMPCTSNFRSADAEGAADATASSPSIATIVAAHPARVHTDTLSREMKAMIKVQGNQSHHIARYCGSYCILQRTTHHEHSRFCPPPRGPAGRGLPDVERCRGGGAVHPARHHLPPLLGTHVSSRERAPTQFPTSAPHPTISSCHAVRCAGTQGGGWCAIERE